VDLPTLDSGSTASDASAFASDFESLTGHPPFRWQQRLFARFIADDLASAVDLPTGLGKTSIIAIWLLARALNPKLPRRLVYVVDRRVVVDQATAEAVKLQEALAKKPELADVHSALGLSKGELLPISTLRGQFADNRTWLADPSRPAIVVGTVDMIGSRLLFEGYGVSRGMRPYQAGMLGADTLVVLDEAHLCPPFEALLRGVEGDDKLKPRGEARRAVVPEFRLLSLSATGRAAEGDMFRLQPEDVDREAQPIVYGRVTAGKRLALHDLGAGSDLAIALAERAWTLGEGSYRVLVFCDAYNTAQAVEAALRKRGANETACAIEVLVGKRRVFERGRLVESLTAHGFIHPPKGERPLRETPAFLVATSAGEVGIDVDADHMVCDLVAYERMVQRLGRVNRRGGDGRVALVEVLCLPPEMPKADAKDDEKKRKAEARTALLTATKALLNELPPCDEGRLDASPRALAELKGTAGATRIDAATTPAPLRPALDRAVVDAWSLTSLPEHPGRPEPEPWLRGWVEDDEPQAQVLWRRFLPWRAKTAEPVPADVEAFFDAARPHASEMLEAPVDLVVSTLIARARTVVESSKKTDDPQAAPAGRPETQEGLLVLTPARELKRLRELPRGARPGAGLGAWTVEELAEVPPKGASPEREAMRRLLSRAIVVVSASLGGLDGNGLLAPDTAEPPPCADSNDAEATGWATGFRVEVRNAADSEPKADKWTLALRLPLTAGEEDDPRTLTVLVARTSEGERPGEPALSRRAQSLAQHGDWAAAEAGRLADALGLTPDYRAMLVAAAGAHDLGKARDLWQSAMRAPHDSGRPYAKTTGAGDPARLKIGPYTYRHEFGSLRDVGAAPTSLAGVPAELRDLALHLIAAHHGYARPLIAPVDPAATPAESAGRAAATALRFARLQRDWGPWGLAWWEAVLRAADWRASARNDAAGAGENAAPARPAPAEEPA